jgi:hypothetical protein
LPFEAVLLVLEITFPAIGVVCQKLGSITLMILTVAKNTINITIIIKPTFANFLALSILLLPSKTSIAEKANTATIGTVIDTKMDRFGNSDGENEEIVRRIKRPEIIVASAKIMSLESRFSGFILKVVFNLQDYQI